MKGKLVNQEDLVLDTKYWIEFVGEDWESDCKDGIHIYEINIFGRFILKDIEGDRFTLKDTQKDCVYEIKIYEIIPFIHIEHLKRVVEEILCNESINRPPNTTEIMTKINEMIDVLNNMNKGELI